MNAVLVEGQALSGRRRGILDYVTEQGAVPVSDLLKRFSLSRASINRDLLALSAQGLIRRIGTNITALPSVSAPGSVMYRTRQAVAEKRAIARLAAFMVSPGDTVALDDSTTVRAMAESLSAISPLTVVTNSLGLATRLGPSETVTLIGLGGHYTPTFEAFAGMICEESVMSMRIDLAFVSAAAIHDLTAYHQVEEIIRAKRALLAVADCRVLLADSRKFGISAMNRLSTLSEFDVVVTDDGIDPVCAEQLRDAGVSLKIAPVSRPDPPLMPG
ncbi:DeoR/GlpR transcriptional regulator [Gluconobacter sp. Dm-62]|uniref:DeoR/GlpR family DNA-binding transcription regulator n=1 Tax=Gluconobacter sp. Dm-62 TaxID=2799804 RepID=UPI001B8AB3EA|nr:DeoR/GlpR family DNA-binding transcription regulator [Gluconobacter sp. Dm-62]MBS1103136.1 DeoR/GlpR transcriptional regulator [Gluconobacter sp. Dm-62]